MDPLAKKPAAAEMPLPASGALALQDLHEFVDNTEDYAIFTLDRDGRVASWNRGAERMNGYTVVEIIGESLARLYPSADVEAGIPERELSIARTLGRSEDEGWRARKDGSRLWANAVITALRDEHGGVRGFGVIVRDLTARRARELQLREAEQRFHELVDAVTDYAIFVLDVNGYVATWNAGAVRSKGYSAAEIIGQHFSEFYTAEDRAAGVPERNLDVVRREGRFEDEGWRVRKDGTHFWANVVITSLRNERGELVGFANVTRDLSERRVAMERVRQSEERFRLLVESVTDYAIYMLDPEGRVTTWNAGAERMKGYAAHEAIGLHFSTFFPEEDRAAGRPEQELEIASTQGRFAEEGWRVRKDGTRLFVNVVVTALRDATGRLLGFAKVTRDLTARRQADATERELLRAQLARSAAEQSARALARSEEAAQEAARRAEEAAARAEEANRVKDEFLATVSHELRTPLNAILGWSSILRTRKLEDSVAKGITVIHRNAESQARLIEDILDVSRMVTGQLRLDVKPIDPVALVSDAIEVVRPSAAAKDIHVDFTSEDSLPPLIGDAGRLQQVVWNLLSNAVKFTDRDGLVRVRVELHASSLVISVRDTGRGIDPEFLPYVFDRFKQAEATTTRRFGGLGLGLSIVRHLVELHGGRVSVESGGRGAGALFRVLLPIRAVATDASERPPRERERRTPVDVERRDLRGARVLVVDDELDARELLEHVLVAAGATVQTAGSADAGFEAVQSFRPQVLVSDIGMPEKDGYSLARRVHTLEPQLGGGIPAIALTAYARDVDREKALNAGFSAHLAKPVKADDLIAEIARLVASTQ